MAKSSKKTKAQLEQELESLKLELVSEKENLFPAVQEMEKARIAEIRESTKDLSLDTLVSHMASLRTEISKVLADLGDKLTNEITKLDEIREGIKIETRELERVHKIDVVAMSLSQMLNDYENQKQALEEDIKVRRQEWDEEKKAREGESKEYWVQLKKQREREKEEYEYQLAKEQQKREDEQKILEANWKEREEALKKQEVEVARLKKEAEVFPKRQEEAVAKALAENEGKWSEKYQQEALLTQKEFEAEKKVLGFQVQNSQERVSKLVEEIQALRQELKVANQQVQVIAERAIDGASESRALAHVNKIAMEQAKHPIGKA